MLYEVITLDLRIALIYVRVQLLGELPVRGLDLAVAGALGHAKHRIRISHKASTPQQP